jgi:hypothetical protein
MESQVFGKWTTPETEAENKLKERLAKLLGITEEHIELWQVEENHLCDLFESHGLH